MIGTQISPSSESTHLQFPNHSFHSFFVLKKGVRDFGHHSADTCRTSNLDIPTAISNAGERNSEFLLSIITFELFIVPNNANFYIFDWLLWSIESTFVSDSRSHAGLVRSIDIWATEHKVEQFSVVNNSSHLPDRPKRTHDQYGNRPYNLDLVFTSVSHLIKYSHSPSLLLIWPLLLHRPLE